MTQRNLSEFSLECNPLGFNDPRIHFSSPDVAGCCLPQAVLARNLAVRYHMDGFPGREGGPLSLGPASQESEPVGCLREFRREAAPVAPLLTRPCHTVQLALAQAQVIYIVAQQQAGPVLRATLAH